MGLGRAAGVGAVGGVVGAALMLPVFEGAKRAGLVVEAPPERVVERAADEVAGSEARGATDEGAWAALVAGNHLLYGAAAGAVYGTLQEELKLPANVAGVGYGLALWAVGYLGWMPAVGAWARPWRQGAGAALVPLAAHVVYGLALGTVEGRARRG